MIHYRNTWIALGLLALLSPFGLILPDHFKAGAAWGEWGAEEMTQLVGYIPNGLARLSTLWKAPMPDYAFHGWESKGLTHLSLSYIVSAIVGIVVIAILFVIFGKFIAKGDKQSV